MITAKQTGTLPLQFAWRLRLLLKMEGRTLWEEGNKLKVQGKLMAVGNKLMALGNKLMVEGDNLWAAAVLEAHSNVAMEWIWRQEKQTDACVLETGEIFEP